ncbi:ornithine--oxo-acid transaminase [Azospira restricta]|uniref:Ornithine--oxo-acid aminotransferase n=2 Tax=Azospira restricta TaxID=404405 RepID=A0A974SSJ4_9RHOO|nr:ornithine--oxo-acid transaminase [Azospira restricta]
MLRFIGVASALGAPLPDPKDGPAALREMGIVAAARRAGLDGGWGTSIEAPPGPRLPALAALLEQVAHEVAASLASGRVPVILGGDHSIAAGTWRGVGRALGEAPGLIWIDAHLDAHTPDSSPTHNAHGMPLAALLGAGAPEMCAVDGPPLDPQRVAVIGVRSYEPEEMRLLAAFGVPVYGIAEIRRRGLPTVFAEALQIVAGDSRPFGISVDLDALDPRAAPGVSTPVADGLAVAELATALAGLIRDGRCRAFEIAEYCPARDAGGLAARAAIDLLEAACRPDAAGLRQWEETRGAANYAPLPVVLASGEGCWLRDVNGARYLDLMSAYSAVSFGHAQPRLVATLSAQAARLAVTSRAYSNDRLPLFLKRLTDITGYARALPVNTGLEAVETAIKAARKWGHKVKGIADGRAEIIACHGNFHGRSTTIVGFSSEAQYRDGFGPFAPGFRLIPYGDAAALDAAITPHTAAFLVEPIQGEGGIIIPPDGYLAACADICRRHDVLLIADEVQTGLGRTGYLLASEHDGVRADGVILGKALGGGLLPVSAFLADERVMQVFTPGDHGSTFGGNALSAAVAAEALELLGDLRLVEHSAELGRRLLARLAAIAAGTPLIRAVRGRGLFAGIEVDAALTDARALAEALLKRGVLTKDTHGTVLRIAPPLTISAEELDWGLDRIAEVFADAGKSLPRLPCAA